MKKETLLEIILGTIGGLVFAIGMCMCLLPEWNMFTAGVITTIIVFVLLLLLCLHQMLYRHNVHGNLSLF